MKRRLIAALAVAAVAGSPVLAADMPARVLSAYVPYFTWQGFYVGLNAGYGFGRSSWTDTVTQVSTGKFNVTGAMAGGTVGYNLQFGGWILGIEADAGWSNIKGSTATNCIGPCETSNEWLGTARGRIGYAFDRFLPYVTGGAAFGGIKATVAGLGFSDTAVGWAGGGGLEYAFGDRWTAKVEYLYVDLGKTTCSAGCSAGNPIDVTFTSNIVRGGVNYKF
jgi:outer membrane immunogenic protein